ncbi:tetratricopeptide repeat protein [Streptomyces griseoaurantiacus]|uniref:tetratricopeptide repeat protein n=1 Tax=Streptomyces griseoaurantiacus TaxID=68213 RepID=UPI00345FA973
MPPHTPDTPTPEGSSPQAPQAEASVPGAPEAGVPLPGTPEEAPTPGTPERETPAPGTTAAEVPGARAAGTRVPEPREAGAPALETAAPGNPASGTPVAGDPGPGPREGKAPVIEASVPAPPVAEDPVAGPREGEAPAPRTREAEDQGPYTPVIEAPVPAPPVAEDPAPGPREGETPVAGPREGEAPVAGTPVAPVPGVSAGGGASVRTPSRLHLVLSAGALAVALTTGALATGAARQATPAPASLPVTSPQLLSGDDLAASIRGLQAHLRAQPRDAEAWSTLALAYVEQARTEGDPSRYPQADKALDRALELRPHHDPALAGRAALAAARHDFRGALKYADEALSRNPYNERALCSRIDALVELGRYEEASKAADLADSRRPGVPVFTRYAYVRELRGDTATAREVLTRALGTAATRGDVAYVATALGQLAWNQGQYRTALRHYARALAADDTYLPALEGRARTQAALGDRAAAITGMERVVARAPLPQPLVELGELYEERGGKGDTARARDQYALVHAWVSLARANGVDADLDTALAAADHGERGAALKAARAEWKRRHTVHTADALAWALHVNGRDEEALPYARRATATGYRSASFRYHRGMIERAAGRPDRARASLTAALGLNPGFAPLGARAARAALASLGGPE